MICSENYKQLRAGRISDPTDIRWAGLARQNAGSVGKVICMVGLFHALDQAFPQVADRQRWRGRW